MTASKVRVCITLAPSTLQLIRAYQSKALSKGHAAPAISAVIDKVLTKSLSK